MRRRLSEGERGELEHRAEQLRLELRLLEAQLRSDEVLRAADKVRRESERDSGRPRLAGRWRDWTR
jgi:hypothetical protein